MPNTTPATTSRGSWSCAGGAGRPGRRSGSSSTARSRPGGGRDAGALGELADAGVVGFSDDGAPVRNAAILRNALAYAGRSGCRSSTTPRTRRSPGAPRRTRGYVATVLGLQGWPARPRPGGGPGDRDPRRCRGRRAGRAAPPDPRVDGGGAGPRSGRQGRRPAGHLRRHAPPPRARPTSGSRARGAGPGRRWTTTGPRATLGPTGPSRRRRSTRRCASTPPPGRPRTPPPCLAALVDGTADAIATDHAPHTEVDKHVEFGWAANGISGIETAIGLVLAAVDAGGCRSSRDRGAHHRSRGGARRAAGAPRPPRGRAGGPRGHRPGRTWRVDADSLSSKGKNSPSWVASCVASCG